MILTTARGENQHVRRIRNVGWVRQTLEGALKFDFEDGISMVYNSNEITYIDVLKGPAEKYNLSSLDQKLGSYARVCAIENRFHQRDNSEFFGMVVSSATM